MKKFKLPKYQQARSFLLEELSSRKFRVGSKFYSNNKIAQMFEISPITASKAFHALEEEGYIGRKKGFGSIVLKIPKAPRQLKVIEHKSIGILTGNIEMEGNVVLAKLLLGLHKRLSDYGFMISLAHKSEKQLIDAGVDGIIAIGFFNEQSIKNLKASKIPVVGHGAYLKGRFPCACLNYHKTALDVCGYLYKRGHKKIMFLGSGKEDVFVYKEYADGIKEFLSMNGLSESMLSRKVRMKQNIYDELRASLSRPEKRPDAIFLMSWLSIALMLQAVNDENLRIPDDISVIVNGINALSSNTVPKLASVCYDLDASCEQTVKIILQLIKNREYQAPDYIFESSIYEEESCINRNN